VIAETHEVNSLLIEQGDKVPENVTMFSLQQHGSLADAELWFCGDGPDPRVDVVAGECVVVFGALAGFHGREGCPLLADGGNELTRVVLGGISGSVELR